MGTRVKNSSVGALQKETLMTRAHIPPDWDDNTIITVKDLADLSGVPEQQLQAWSRQGLGPRWHRFQGRGCLYITAAEARRYLQASKDTDWGVPSAG